MACNESGKAGHGATASSEESNEGGHTGEEAKHGNKEGRSEDVGKRAGPQCLAGEDGNDVDNGVTGPLGWDGVVVSRAAVVVTAVTSVVAMTAVAVSTVSVLAAVTVAAVVTVVRVPRVAMRHSNTSGEHEVSRSRDS